MTTTARRRLTWGNKHSLTLLDNATRTLANLNLVKDKGEQKVPISLPHAVNADMIEKAWLAQGKNWIEIVLAEGSPFLAVRVIWLPKGSIVWFTFHLFDAPFDGCSYTDLTKETWDSTRIGKLVLQR